eukprot:8635967-Pyramimonas_sp.AAC.1
MRGGVLVLRVLEGGAEGDALVPEPPTPRGSQRGGVGRRQLTTPPILARPILALGTTGSCRADRDVAF